MFLDRADSRVRLALIDEAGPSQARDLLSFLADERPAIRRVLLSDAGRRTPFGPAGLAQVDTNVDAILAKPWDHDSLARTLHAATP